MHAPSTLFNVHSTVICIFSVSQAEMMLAAIGLEAYFDQLIIGEECQRAKPHPDPYEVFPNDAAHSKRPTCGAHGLL